MTFEIVWSAPAHRDIERLDPPVAARIRKAVTALAQPDGPRAAAVRKALGRRKSLRGVRVTLGEQHATFTRVVLERLADLGRPLAKLALPKDTGRS